MNKTILIILLALISLVGVLYTVFKVYKKYKESNEIASLVFVKSIDISESTNLDIKTDKSSQTALNEFEKYILSLYNKDKFESIIKLDGQINKLNTIFVNFDKNKYKPITENDKTQIKKYLLLVHPDKYLDETSKQLFSELWSIITQNNKTVKKNIFKYKTFKEYLEDNFNSIILNIIYIALFFTILFGFLLYKFLKKNFSTETYKDKLKIIFWALYLGFFISFQLVLYFIVKIEEYLFPEGSITVDSILVHDIRLYNAYNKYRSKEYEKKIRNYKTKKL